jgi:hypothetical protein
MKFRISIEADVEAKDVRALHGVHERIAGSLAILLGEHLKNPVRVTVKRTRFISDSRESSSCRISRRA